MAASVTLSSLGERFEVPALLSRQVFGSWISTVA